MTQPGITQSYRAALRRFDNSAIDDAAKMAGYCRDQLEMAVGTVDPEKVWTGAQRRGILLSHLLQLVQKSPQAVFELQWVR